LASVGDDEMEPSIRGLLVELKILCTAPPGDIDDVLDVM
jgi:hypothetical protein